MNTPRNTNNSPSNSNGSADQASPATFTSQSSTSNHPSSQVNREEILQLLALLRDKLPPLRDLTADERQALTGMGDANRNFAGKILEVILQDPDFLPRSFNVHQYQNNLNTFDDLSAIARVFTQILDLLNATVTAIGSEVHEDSLNVYRYAKASNQGASMEAMMADLKQRFALPKRKKEKNPEKPEINA